MHSFTNHIATYLALGLTLGHCGFSEPPSALKVTNGLETQEQDPAVVLLRFGQGNICSGAYIRDDIILTAAHCTQSQTRIEVVRPEQTMTGLEFMVLSRSLAVLTNPRYTKAEDIQHDLGLVKMPAGSSRHWLPITTLGVHVGEHVRLVGFGHDYINQYTDAYVMTEKGAGVKRSGTNRIASVSDGALRFQGFISPRMAKDQGQPLGMNVGIGGGDSGGPLLNLRGELAGVASAQDPTWGEWESIRALDSVFVDLAFDSAQAFLRETDKL